MTPLIKTALSLLAASATGVSGGLLYDNKDEILKFFGWTGENVSNEPTSDPVTPPSAVDQTDLQRSSGDGIPVPSAEIQDTNLSPVGDRASEESRKLGDTDPSANPMGNLNSGDSQNLKSQDNNQVPQFPATSVPSPALKNFQCAFEEKNYESEPNKKELKKFLEEKGKVGLQVIINETDKTYKCAKSLGEDESQKLLDYLKTRGEMNRQSGKRNEDALPIAVKQKADGNWTIFENDGENETLAPIQDNSPME